MLKNIIINSDVMDGLKELPDNFIDCCVTSPPYFNQRDYGVVGQIGLEKTPEEYITKLVEVFGEVKRVLKKEGTLWLNLGDSYNGSGKASSGGGRGEFSQIQAGNNGSLSMTNSTRLKNLKPKDLIGIPWMAAFALRTDGWYLRQDIIWHKPSTMPESVKDRCTKAHEYIFLLSKNNKYYYDNKAIEEEAVANRWGGAKPINVNNSKDIKNQFSGLTRERNMMPEIRNKRSVWTINTIPYKGAHFATFPPALIEPMILAGCPEGGTVLDPFFGSGTTGMVAIKNRRNYIGIELNSEYIKLANDRIKSIEQNLF